MRVQARSGEQGSETDKSAAYSTGDDGAWWSIFRRPHRPAWLGRRSEKPNRGQDHLRLEREKLAKAISARDPQPQEILLKKRPTLDLSPMPVGGIPEPVRRKETSAAKVNAESRVSRAGGDTGTRIIEAMDQVDATLTGVRSTQIETVGALVNVGEKIDHASFRFEDLFDRISKAEQTMAEDYRKLQHRTLYSIALIAAAVILVLCLFMTAPWG